MEAENEKRSPDRRSEIKSIVFTVFLVLLAAAAVFFLVRYYFDRVRTVKPQDIPTQQIAGLKDITLSSKALATPYVTTDIDGVVYTVNTASEVSFFEFNGSEYKTLSQTGEVKLNVPLSNQQIPVTVHYIERDGKITGYGVYMAKENDSIYIYDFLLCKITNMPAGFEKQGKYLLLANTDKKNVYSLSPVWEEAYELDMNSKTLTRFLSEDNRMLDINGAVRSDFCMLTDAALKSSDGQVPFFSGRAYDVTGEKTSLDIYFKTQSKEAVAVEDVLDTYVKTLADGSIAYLKAIDSGFAVRRYSKGENVTVREFYSEYGAEYIRNGDWLLCKEDGRLYSLTEDTVIELPEYKMNPNCFCVSDDGRYVVLAGSSANAFDYRIYIFNTQSGAVSSFGDDDYSTHFNLFFADSAKVCFYTESAEGFVETVIDISKIG